MTDMFILESEYKINLYISCTYFNVICEIVTSALSKLSLKLNFTLLSRCF